MKNKIGTIWCWLFGHKFIVRQDRDIYIVHRPSNWCCRCGITKEELERDIISHIKGWVEICCILAGLLGISIGILITR